jgi:hypothetical protein
LVNCIHLRISVKIAIAFFVFLAIHFDSPGQSSILSAGQWSKFSVTSDGIFKIDYNLLKGAGFNPDQIDPRKLKLYTGLNGMLPQANSTTRPEDLTEMAIYISGESDGKFNPEDYVLFYGKGPDSYSFNTAKGVFNYENNLYSDKNFYFITAGTTNGKRVETVPDLGPGFPIINEFEDLVFYEKDSYNILKSGREWVGEQFDSNTELKLGFDMPGIVENSSVKLISNVMAQSFNGSSFRVFYNDTQVVEQVVSSIPNTQYGIKGRYKADTITMNASVVLASSRTNQELKYQYIKDPAGSSVGYLNYFLISFKRKLALYGKETIFTSSKSLSNATSTFNVSNFSSESLIWNITDPFNAQLQSNSFAGGIASFSTSTALLKNFIVFIPSGARAPTFENVVANQNLHAINNVDLIIVTHPTFESEAARLANHRSSYNRLSVKVVTTTQIYNEYSGGKQDVTAVRDFIRNVYINSGKQLKNLLLFGRCSYDYRNRVFNNTNFVPTYESRNSLSPLETYSSDDYFGFLDDTEGTWSEDPVVNHTLDIGVGRLTIKKIEEAHDVVDKLIDYDTHPAAKGKWRNEILFVADDGDSNLHQDQAEQLAVSLGNTHPEFHLQKVYIDAYAQNTRPSGQTSPDARLALEESLRNGSVIVNFTGHGSEQVWMDERILDATTISTWENKNRYPLMVTATCEFGRHDDPALISTSELALLKKQGGAIGLVTTSRPVYSTNNFALNQSFYVALFKKENGKYRDVGSIFRDTKNTSLSGVGNRNFSLLGDPSMHLAMPETQIVIDEIKTASNSDTLKALSHVTVKGRVHQAGVTQTNFTGTLQATLFDKEAALKTRGDENAAFDYLLWNNPLYSGQASIKEGRFQFDFILPQNMATLVSKGKLNLYAQGTSGDAAGALLNFAVGKIEQSPIADGAIPTIKLFMGDTTFINGGITGSSTTLIAKLQDQSGINISAYGSVNHSAVATLDNLSTFVLNNYYQSDVDNYTEGTIQFPLVGLSEGRHTLVVKVWDTYNNPTSSQIDFVVTDAQQLEIQEFFNYPNPFSNSTEILFSHNRPGQDLEAFLSIYSVAGQSVTNFTFTVIESQARVRLTEWDGTRINGTKLDPGLYIMKVLVRSLQDGSKNEQITKLIILN